MVVVRWGADTTEYIVLIVNAASILGKATNDEYKR